MADKTTKQQVYLKLFGCIENSLGKQCSYFCEILPDFSHLLDGENSPIECWDTSQVIGHTRHVM